MDNKEIIKIGNSLYPVSDYIRYIKTISIDTESALESDYTKVYIGKFKEDMIDRRLLNYLNTFINDKNIKNSDTDNDYRKFLFFKFNKRDTYMVICIIQNKKILEYYYDIYLYI